MRISLVLLSLLLTACGSLPHEQSSDNADAASLVANDFARSRLIADDFVAAMVQLPQLEPNATTLTTTIPASRFGQLLMHSMQSAGYEFRVQASNFTNNTETSNPALSYFVNRRSEVDDAISSNPISSILGVYEFMIEAGTVKLKRSYEVDTDGVWPASSMYVLGADAAGLQLDASLFDDQHRKPNLPAGAIIASAPEEVLPTSDSTDSPLRNPALNARAYTSPTNRVSAQPMAGPLPNAVSTSARSSGPMVKLPIKRNMYDLERSNYAELFDNYETLERKVLVFANDSMIMGDSNKKVTEAIARNFDSSTDLISVIGCSHGSTALRNGNAVLANGRASRVKEEFLIAGIDSELVLDEGCWAGSHFDKMPPRGVVVTHKRRS